MSLINEPCEHAKNRLDIIDNQPPDGVKKNFVVCTKHLHLGSDFSATRFVEWVEMLKILGAEQIYIYHRYVNPDCFKIMLHYEKQGFMVLEQYLETSAMSASSFEGYGARLNELPIFNDCLYRVKNLYKYIVPLDFDEILIPTKKDHETWMDLISYLKNDKIDSYAFRSVTFPPMKEAQTNSDIPKDFYMLRHTMVRSGLWE